MWKLTTGHGVKGRWAWPFGVTPPLGAPAPTYPVHQVGHPEPPPAPASWGTPLKLPYVHNSYFSAAATTQEPALDTGGGGAHEQGANIQEEAPSALQNTSCCGFILTLPLGSVFINSARPQQLPEPQL